MSFHTGLPQAVTAKQAEAQNHQRACEAIFREAKLVLQQVGLSGRVSFEGGTSGGYFIELSSPWTGSFCSVAIMNPSQFKAELIRLLELSRDKHAEVIAKVEGWRATMM